MTLVGADGLQSQGQTLVRIQDLGLQELRTEAFALRSEQEITIDAVGAEPSRSILPWKWKDKPPGEDMPWVGNAWILNTSTRKVVWELRTAGTTRDDKGLNTYSGRVRLPAGVYTAHFAAYVSGIVMVRGPEGAASRVVVTKGGDVPTEAFNLSIRGSGERVGLAEMAKTRAEFEKNTFIVLTGLGRQDVKHRGFTVSEPLDIEIYCVGEARKDGSFDYGTLMNADTREVVWQLTYKDSEPAGGASKNRMVRRKLTLKPGRYAASYATDDSHDQREWNEAPPFDVDYWGLTLFVADPAARRTVRTFDYDPVPRRDAIVTLTKVANSKSESAGFVLTRETELRVYALGEGSHGTMHDHGWITDATTKKRVWEMEYEKTTHAGGAAKNRLADETVRLGPGSYLAYYTTDDSHAYGSWNAPQPVTPELWGISVFLARGAEDRAAVKAFESPKDDSVIAQLTRMGDDEDARKRFRLDKDMMVRVYALGEGSGGELVDFAWIEKANTRDIVWQMDPRKTSHAGGSHKNRGSDVTIALPAGEYILRYESDDSHSYAKWNATPPDDPEAWGVTVFRAPVEKP